MVVRKCVRGPQSAINAPLNDYDRPVGLLGERGATNVLFDREGREASVRDYERLLGGRDRLEGRSWLFVGHECPFMKPQ